jgi:hypothetical protein
MPTPYAGIIACTVLDFEAPALDKTMKKATLLACLMIKLSNLPDGDIISPVNDKSSP